MLLAPAHGSYSISIRLGFPAELLLLGCRQLDVQDAILELCVDILFLYALAHIEAAGAGAGEGLAADVMALVILLIIAVITDG